MKPIVTSKDFKIIDTILSKIPSRQRTNEVKQLEDEIKKATIVDLDNIENDIIRLNSTVEVLDMELNRTMVYTITTPELSNFSENRISLLTPLAIALIGFRKGMIINWEFPGGPKKLKIRKVQNFSKK